MVVVVEVARNVVDGHRHSLIFLSEQHGTMIDYEKERPDIAHDQGTVTEHVS